VRLLLNLIFFPITSAMNRDSRATYDTKRVTRIARIIVRIKIADMPTKAQTDPSGNSLSGYRRQNSEELADSR